MKLSVSLVLLPFAQCSLRGLLSPLRSLSIGARYGAPQILVERDVLLDAEPQKFHNRPVFSRHNYSGGASSSGLNWDTENPVPEEILVEKIRTEPENLSIAPIDTKHLLQSNHVKPPKDSSVVSPHTARFPPIILRPLNPGREKLVISLDRTLLGEESTKLKYFIDKTTREFIQKRLGIDSRSAQLHMEELIRLHGSVSQSLLIAKNPKLADYQEYLDGKLASEKTPYHRDLEALLKRVDADIVLFTDFSEEHARKVLEDHELLSYFHMIIAADPENPDCPVKPSPEAFERVNKALLVAPNFIYYLDDNIDHIRAAHRFGWNRTKFPKYYQQQLRTNFPHAYGITEMSRLFRVMFPSPITHFRLPPTPGRPKLIFTLNSLARDGGGIEFFYEQAKWKFIDEYLGISEEHVSSLVQELYKRHGSVAKGLAAVYGVEPAVYEEFLFNNAKYERIYRDENVVRLLKDVDADIFVVADVSKWYAEKVLERLGVLPLVREIFISHHEDPEFNDKPPSEIFDRMEAELGVDPSSIYFVCRKTSYLKATLNLGWNVARIAERYDDGSFHGPPLLFEQDQDSINQIRGTFRSLFASRKERTVIE